MDDIFVYFIDMPANIHEMVTPCAEGYTVYIDQNMSRERQIEAYQHAKKHISRNDFQNGLEAGTIEEQTHKKNRRV